MSCGLRVGLTGGVGSGKSSVAAVFEELGVPVIDADRIARDLVEPGTPALATVVDELGPEVLGPGGQLDRRRLRERVFSDPLARARLEAVLHPRVRARMEDALRATDAPYCVLCIPLLLESGQTDLVDRVLVVDVPEALQVARVCARDRVDPAAAEAILRAQAGRQSRLAAADDVISNTGSLEELRGKVLDLHRRYRSLAAARLPARG
jgi:dephospho-CoA kinase